MDAIEVSIPYDDVKLMIHPTRVESVSIYYFEPDGIYYLNIFFISGQMLNRKCAKDKQQAEAVYRQIVDRLYCYREN